MSAGRRLEDLRRRVREDPASMAFAPLAEEYRRAGQFQDAIAVCRGGLALHPGYLSARVTLGRSLAAVGSLDEAHDELRRVLATAPENLAARRALGDLHYQRGELSEALTHYQVAHDLAPGDLAVAAALRQTAARLASHAPAHDARSTVDRTRAFRAIERLGRWLAVLHGSRPYRRA